MLRIQCTHRMFRTVGRQDRNKYLLSNISIMIVSQSSHATAVIVIFRFATPAYNADQCMIKSFYEQLSLCGVVPSIELIDRCRVTM